MRASRRGDDDDDAADVFVDVWQRVIKSRPPPRAISAMSNTARLKFDRRRALNWIRIVISVIIKPDAASVFGGRECARALMFQAN